MKIILTVTNDIATDQRVQRSASTFIKHFGSVEIAGRMLKDSPPIQRPYPCRRFRLWFNKGPLFYANYNIRLFFYLLFKHYDGVLANDLDTLPAAFLATHLRKKKLLYDSHEYFPEVPELQERPFIQKIWYGFERMLIPRLPFMITVSSSIAKIYQKKYGIPVHTIRNLPFYDFKQDVKSGLPVALPFKQKTLIYQGAVNKGRGLEEMLEAMTHIDGVTLVIAGEGDLSPKIAAIINNRRLGEKVVQTGRLAPAALRVLTAHAHGGISLEKDLGLNYRYALPNKLFDYIQAGIPVLTSRLPEMEELVNTWQIGLTIDSHQPGEIARKVKQLLFNNELRHRWQSNLALAAQTLCWEQEEEKLRALFQGVFNKN